jgi:two-component system, OmpR family, sensor kinase
MGRILLVEDDAPLGEGVKSGLEDEGRVVEWVRDGRHGREALAVEGFGAVVLDLTLPRLDGLQILRELRARKDHTPVLILTARDTVQNRVEGLDAGADDYLVKPFALAELKARVRSLTRRAAGRSSNRLEHLGVVLDRESRRVVRDGQPVDLSPREFSLLEALLEHPGRTLSRSIPGARRSSPTRSRCMCTTCAPSSSPSSSAPCAASAMRSRARMGRRASLRGNLLVLLLAGTSIVWLGIAAATFLDARKHTARIFDAQLIEYSEVLTAVAGHEVHELPPGSATPDVHHEFGQACTYQVFSLTGELLLRSHAAPEEPLSRKDGFSDVESGGTRWRAFRQIDPENRIVVVVAHQRDEREALVRDAALRLLVPIAFGLPLIGMALWFAVSRAVSPLERLADEVRGRGLDRLTPLAGANAPREVEPLVDALNQLFERLERSFENERRFTGDAAHELRTPLAALKTHAEVALTTASDERRRRSLQQVVDGVDRASRLVEQLLTLARLDSAHAVYDIPVDLAEVTLEALEPLSILGRDRHVTLHFDAPPVPALVRGEASTLQALVRNLVENALRHAPLGGVVRVRIAPESGGIGLEVEDSGAGVPQELRVRIFDRHFRAPGSSGGAAGLGLSIAQRVVELHGGRIEAGESAELGGLRVSVWLPVMDKGSLRPRADSEGLNPRKESVT